MTAATSTLDRATPTAPVRAINRRRPLPNGRALVGALLVTIAAVGTFAVAGSDGGRPDTSYLVTTRPIEAGELIGPDDVTAIPIALPDDVGSALVDRLSAPATALVDLGPDQILRHDHLTEAPLATELPDPIHELTVPVPRDRIADSLTPGDRVTVLSTTSVDGRPATLVAVEDVVVLDWKTSGDRVAASTSGVLTLALPDPDRVLALAHLAQTGDISVVRTTRAIPHVYPPSYPPAYPPSQLSSTPDQVRSDPGVGG